MKLRGAWRRDYSEFFDTQEALLIDAMDNADSIYTVFARLQSRAVKCGCAGKLLRHESVPYTDEMLAAVTKKTVPAFRQCVQPLVQLGLVIYEDGIYAIADWEFNQNAPAIDAMREGNRSRKAKERARKSSYEGIENIIKAIENAKARLRANVNFDLVMELLLLTIKEN